jgi:hypothetical protein
LYSPAVLPAAPTSTPQLPSAACVPGNTTMSRMARPVELVEGAAAAAMSAADKLPHGDCQPPQAAPEEEDEEDTEEAGATNVMLARVPTLRGVTGPSVCTERTIAAVTEVIRNAT